MSSPLEQKLREILDADRKALQVIKNHPGQSYEQIKKSVDLNISAHVSASNHVGLFVYNAMNKKSDLKTLADACAKRIILSDARIEAAFQKLTAAQKAKGAEIINNFIVADLVSYFENLKGKTMDQSKIVDELTVAIVKKIAETLQAKA